MSLAAVCEPRKVVERAGLIARSSEAQQRPCRLEPEPLKAVEATRWSQSFGKQTQTIARAK